MPLRVAKCPEPQAEDLWPLAPFAGVIGYSLGDERPWQKSIYLHAAWVGDYLLAAFEDEKQGLAVLVQRDGRKARAFRTVSLIGDDWYTPLNHQSWIMRVAHSWEACQAWSIAALDPRTLQQRWEYVPPKAGPVAGLEVGSTLLLQIDQEGEPDLLVALQLASGRVLWQRLASSMPDTDGRVFYELAAGELRAFSPATDKTLWTAPLPTGEIVGWQFGARYAAFVTRRHAKSPREQPSSCVDNSRCVEDVAIFDLELRKETHQIRDLGDRLGTQVQGGDVVLLEAVATNGLRASRLRVIDAASGVERFRAPPDVCGATSNLNGTHLSGTERAIHVCGCDGVLRIWGRRTGTLEGSFSVGDCEGLVTHEEDIAHAALLMDLPGAETGPAILRADAFTSPERTIDVAGDVAVEEAWIDKDQWLRIGPQLVRADKRGRFAASVRGRGVLRAEVAVRVGREDETDEGGDAALLLVDRPPQERIRLSLYGPEH